MAAICAYAADLLDTLKPGMLPCLGAAIQYVLSYLECFCYLIPRDLDIKTIRCFLESSIYVIMSILPTVNPSAGMALA